MSDVSSPAMYYEQVVPQQFAAAMADASDDIVGQPELTATYVITGEGGGTYGLRTMGRQLEFVPGGIDGSDIHTTMTIESWRTAVASGISEPIVDYVRRGKVDDVKTLTGTVRLELNDPEGGTFESTTVIGRTEEPEVTLRMTIPDYIAMIRGDLNGQTAFLTGKLKFEGSLPLLMQVGSLND